jgi:hypothetical protein
LQAKPLIGLQCSSSAGIETGAKHRELQPHQAALSRSMHIRYNASGYQLQRDPRPGSSRAIMLAHSPGLHKGRRFNARHSVYRFGNSIPKSLLS